MGDPISLSCFANKVFDKVFDPIVTYLVIYPITALYLCKQNVMKLNSKLGELAIRKMDVQHRVYEAQQRGEMIFEQVKHWMSEVDKHISGSREELKKLECKARRKYCFGRCSNPKSLYDLSRKAEECAGDTDRLMQQAVQFDTGNIISYFHFQKLESISRDRGAQDSFVEFESRKEVLNKIMKALQSPTANMIGVHGMPGMGKTTLVKEVKRKAREEKSFDVVVLAKVTRNPDLIKIQYQIARSLGMFNLPKELTLEQVADRINEGLKKMNVLVILDDVWEKLDLEDLGIPAGTKQKRPVAEQQNKESSSWEEQKVCKVFITSRDPKVLSEKMGVKNDNIFPVNKLDDDDARKLFELRIEDVIENSEFRRSKAIEIVNRCSGLPLAIEKMAAALRGKEDDGWNYLLNELKNSKGGAYDVVCSAIEFSFNQLESRALQQTFLLCCLMGHNASIEDLIEYGTGLKLFPEVNKIEDARDAARTLVGNLKGSSLLLDGPSNILFDMQDAVRDAAISIASRGGGVLTFRDEDVAEVWPDEVAMKNPEWICLSNVDVSQLLQELELVHNSEAGHQQVQCPQLTFFHLSNKDPSLETAVPADFFKGMINLKVLSLSKMHFSSMPQSISLLTNLRTLRLNQSKLGVLDGMGEIIGKLKNLQVLNLAGCDIAELPKELACLTRLKLLDMSDCTSLKVISPQVLSKLSRLEELKMANSFDQWQFIEQHENQTGNASLAELKHLQKLTTVEVCINDIQMIPEGLFNAELKRYKILIGDLWKHRESPSENSKILKLELKASSSYSSVIKLLKVSEELHLEGLHGVRNVAYQLDNEGFQKLRYLYVRNAPEIQFMIDSERLICSNAFPALEELVLQNLTKLEKICREVDVLGATSFNELRIITIECCHQLKNLFSFSVVKQLLQLKEIRLKDCVNVEEIVAEGAQVTVREIEEAATKIELGSLQSMRLEKLPNFISFCQEKNSRITDQGGSRLTSFRCNALFDEKAVFPMLEELRLIDIKIDRIWNTSATPDSVKNLAKLVIVSCNDLKYLFSSSLANGLEKLLHLEIVDCKSLREIIATETGPEMGNCSVEFPSLKRLGIINCPELMGFMVKSNSTNEANDALPLFNEHVAFPCLESIRLYGLRNTKIIWHNQLSPGSFCKLSELDVRNCENLMTIFTKDMLESIFQSIEKLQIWNCASVEEVFNVGEINLKEPVETQLRNLLINYLPSLKHVWNEDPKGILTFHKMESVCVCGCPSIKSVFPVSVANSLRQLQKLQIENCGVEEIVAMGCEGTEAALKFVFPQLSNLKLTGLQRLRYFYPKKHITLWPELKNLHVLDCGCADEEEIRNGQGRPDFPVGQPLFYMREIIPQLERLSLSKGDIDMITESRFKQDFFFNIKVLRISLGIGDESAIFPIGLLRRFFNLEELVLTRCSLDELFPSLGHGEVEEEEQKHSETQLSRIKTLKLEFISNLLHVWSGDSSSVFPNLETLNVFRGDDLISLSTSTSSFKNLTTLEVSFCNEMENLVSVSTVQSLVHIKSMTIRGCLKLTEIVGSQGDLTQDPIIFSSLRYLKLEGLIRLACFCSGSFIFNFPYLEQLIVEKCPKLEIFSKIDPLTPRLLQVQGRKLWNLEGDLNATIQRMYREKVGFIGLMDLSLSEFPELVQNWPTRSLQILDFRCLLLLDICNCNSLRYLLTPSVARSLVSLLNLIIENCTIMEAVIMEEGAENVIMEEGTENKIILPALKYISLDSCSDLTSFYVGSCTFQCVGLMSIKARNCPKMATFASTFPREQEKEHPQAFFSSKVEFPNVETLILCLSTIQQIWHNQLNADSFCQLNFLNVNSCGKLLNIFPLSMMGRLQRLNKLGIRNCESLKEIFQSERLGASSSQSQIPTQSTIMEPTIDKFIFSKLTNLYLHNLPKLKGFYSRMHATEWPSLKKLTVSRCNQVQIFASEFSRFQRTNGDDRLGIEIKYPLFLITKATFPCLEELKLGRNNIMKEVWHGQYPGDYFPKLKVLELIQFSEQSVVQPLFVQSLSNLGKLLVREAPFPEIFQCQGLGSEENPAPTYALAQLSELRLSKLHELTNLWEEESHLESVYYNLKTLEVQECSKLKNLVPSFISFKNLTTLKVSACHELINLVGYSSAKSMVHLTRMSISECKIIKEIVAGLEDEVQDGIVFSQLKYLELRDLPRLARFCSGSCSFEFTSLKEVIVMSCPNMQIFSQGECKTPNKLRKVKFIKDEDEGFWEGNLNSTIQKMFKEKVGYLDLKLSEFPELIEIWYKKPQENLPFKRLKSLEVCNCINMKYLLTPAMALGLIQLHDLTITNCGMMELVITGEGAEEMFPLLNSIILESCSNLTCFYEGSSRLNFSSLKQITVANCPILVTFATSISREQGKEIIVDDGGSEERLDIPTGSFFNDKVVLPNLEVLQLRWKNVNIIWHTSITSLCVQKLKRLTFQGCDNLEYLFSSSIARGLVMLERLEIRKCKRMREIIVTENVEEKENMMFPQLNFLLIKDLQNLVGFYLGNCIVEFSSLEHLQVLNCPELEGFTVKYFESTNCMDDIPTLFNGQVAFPNLKWMVITHLKKLEIIWHSKIYANSFCRLKTLRVSNCEKLSYVFPSADIEGRIWKSLEELYIYQCGSLEGILEIGEFNVKQTHAVIDTKLRRLTINNLPRLKHVWNKDPQGILTFHNLESVEVSCCGSLKNLFPASIGKSLLQLQKLYLHQCGVEEIVTMGEQEAEAIVNFIFPRVSSLILEVLPRLQCLYPGKHTTKWPMLKEFCFSHFNQVKRTDGCGQLDFPVRLPLFSIEKIIPQLEKLSLGRHDIAMICEHESKQDILFNAKVLQIRDYLDDELDVLPIGFLKRFCHLENLIVRYCNLKELFPSKGEVEEQEKHIEIETLLRIKTLNLKYLPYLKNIWSDDSSTVLQNLETLDIVGCDSLIILSTSISSFQNLTTLSVTNCKGMINLVSVSTAQSLVQLESMTVKSCHMLTEIVGNEGDGMQDYIMITFTKLKFLTLHRLPRLESFCSENFTFKFPCLEELTVNQCPKLKIFSEGDLNTPLLKRVSTKEKDKYRWEGDLNTTIQRAYMEEVEFAGLELLMLSEFPNLMETWHIKNLQELLDFRQLQVLEICNCSEFKYLLTHSMAMGLVQLFQLIVKNCGTMEQVIMGEGAENKMEFPYLWLINLESCSDLTSFYVGSHILELLGLHNFIVKDCPKMVTCVASTSSKEHDKEESQYLFSSKVETPDLMFLSLSSNNIQQILDNAISDISSYVQNLRELFVEGCGNLKYLLTSSMVKSFEQLNWLEIRACHMMEEVIFAKESVDEERMCKIFFPNLEFLLLEDLPKLTRFCSGNYLELPCLWKLKISKCPMLKTFVSSSIFGDMIASSENVKNTSTPSLFDTKVAFPKLERFVIEHVKSLNNIWNNQLEVDSFCQLTLVSVVSCEKLLNIFPFSMLERLQRVDKLQIWNCDSLEEILESQGLGVSQSQAQKTTPLPLLETITCLEDDVKDGIVFTKLKYLQLCGLPRLSSFCSVKCKFEFTFLEEVILMDCPSMQIFSMDEIRTPKLQKVKLARDDVEGFWAGNLNSTIQLLFKQKSQGDSKN